MRKSFYYFFINNNPGNNLPRLFKIILNWIKIYIYVNLTEGLGWYPEKGSIRNR
jgi:hypothetical protein